MNISINKDIEKYQESVVMGLTARQIKRILLISGNEFYTDV